MMFNSPGQEVLACTNSASFKSLVLTRTFCSKSMSSIAFCCEKAEPQISNRKKSKTVFMRLDVGKALKVNIPADDTKPTPQMTATQIRGRLLLNYQPLCKMRVIHFYIDYIDAGLY